MTKKLLRNTFLASLTVGALWLLVSGSQTEGGKPGGGWGGGGSVPAGRIYYQVNSILTSTSPSLTYETFSGNWNMLADGSNKTFVPNFPVYREPNRNRSAYGSWILSVESVSGTYPNGVQRTEMFAVEESAADPVKIQLTDDAHVEHFAIPGSLRWAHDDSFISFAAVSWTAVASGNFTDNSGQQWQVEAAVFDASVYWTAGVPVAADPIPVQIPVGLYFDTAAAEEQFTPRPDVLALDWSPAGDKIVIEQISQLSGSRSLFVVTLGEMGMTDIVPLGPGSKPEWSPNGLTIAYSAPNADLAPNAVIWSVNPDGTGLFEVTSSSQNDDYDPHWSPDSAHLAFTRWKQSNQKGKTYWQKNVMRVPATGGSVVDLTGDLADNTYAAYANAWR